MHVQKIAYVQYSVRRASCKERYNEAFARLQGQARTRFRDMENRENDGQRVQVLDDNRDVTGACAHNSKTLIDNNIIKFVKKKNGQCLAKKAGQQRGQPCKNQNELCT